MKKIIFIICDGIGDRPIRLLGGKTPLEAANTPNLDRLASGAIGGLVNVMGTGVIPHSDDAHLTIFGYDVSTEYPGRGPIEAAGVGIHLKEGDVAVRSNVATIDENMIVKDRRAGRVEDAKPFVESLDGMKIRGIKFIVRPGTGYRAAIVMRGRGLSEKITPNDPEEAGKKILMVKPLDDSREARFTADVLNEFLETARKVLSRNPINEGRRAAGLPEVTCLLARGAGTYKKLESFEKRHGMKACCIAGAGMYKGIGSILGMDVLKVKGATGLPNTDVKAKINAAIKALRKYDFVFVHIKPTDSLGEDGNIQGKKDFIEKIDMAVKPLASLDCGIIITADHSTPCENRGHSADPPPIMIFGSAKMPDGMKAFSEKECSKGSLGIVNGKDVMKTVKSLLRS